MKNRTLEEIKDHVMNKLKNEFTYCSVMDSPNLAILNTSTADEIDIEVKIEIKVNSDK